MEGSVGEVHGVESGWVGLLVGAGFGEGSHAKGRVRFMSLVGMEKGKGTGTPPGGGQNLLHMGGGKASELGQTSTKP